MQGWITRGISFYGSVLVGRDSIPDSIVVTLFEKGTAKSVSTPAGLNPSFMSCGCGLYPRNSYPVFRSWHRIGYPLNLDDLLERKSAFAPEDGFRYRINPDPQLIPESDPDAVSGPHADVRGRIEILNRQP